MPRDVPVGNGTMLVAFDRLYRIRDFTFPHVGQENHAGHRPFRFGVWADGRLSWVHDKGWSRALSYEDDTLVSHAVLRNPDLALELVCADAVDFHLNVYLRHVLVRNLAATPRAVRLFLHHDFNVLGNDVGDTAYFDPATRSVIHYKGARYFLANCCGPDACGIASFATGVKGRQGFEGTYRDADDGQLSGNPIAQGSVDSIIAIDVDLPAGGEAPAHYWIIAGTSYDEVLRLDRLVLDRTPAVLIQRTRDYWRRWVNKEDWDLSELPRPVARLFKTSLLVLRTQVDDHGPILAANDSDFLHFSRDTYSYCWPRDGALVCRALDLAGYGGLTRKFFEFCAAVVRPEGYLMHKYNPDGTVASSWHPWTPVGVLPIQEDESALVLWALWQHYLRYRDIEFVRPLYRQLIIRVGDFLERYRDPDTGLPRPSWDLWEERCGVHAFTCGAVYGGLAAAGEFAEMFGQHEKARSYAAARDAVRRGMDDHLYCRERGRFLRSLLPRGSGTVPDPILDASIMGAWAFGAYPLDDPRVLETAAQLRQGLRVKTDVGGMARYENDYYFQVSDDLERVPGNPWLICTLWEALHRAHLCETEEQLADEILPILTWVADRALPSGILAEQLHPETGRPLSVSPLTWSHATFVEAVMTYLARKSQLRVCPTCGLSTFLYSRFGRG